MSDAPFKPTVTDIAGILLKVDQKGGKIWTSGGHTFDEWPNEIEVNGFTYPLREHGMDGEFPWAYYGEAESFPPL